MYHYNGGKNSDGVYHKIINQLPPHHNYIEGFLGSAAIMRHKRIAKGENVGIEIDPEVIDKQIYPAWARVIQDDFFNLVSAKIFYDPGTLVYLDPPYPHSSRRNGQTSLYRHEFTDQQHRNLLEAIQGFRCMVAISTYPNEMYATALKKWRKYEFLAGTHAGKATEVLYMNYPKPTRLHDYNHLGTNFIDRQRIKRKIDRHVKRLLTLSPLERAAIIEAIEKIR